MADTLPLPGVGATGQANNAPSPAATIGQPIPETDPAYLLFAAGQGYRETEAQAYTALRQNAIHQAFQDQMPGMILAGQKQALGTEKTYGDAGAWRTGGRIQAQANDASDLQAKITAANDAQQQQQNDLAAQLADHIANLRMDTSQAALQAREQNALTTAGLGQQAFVNGTQTGTAVVPQAPVGPALPGGPTAATAGPGSLFPAASGATSAPSTNPNNTQTNANSNQTVRGAS